MFIHVQSEINKEELKYQCMDETKFLLLGAPKMPFTAKELTEVRQYIEASGSALLVVNEGGS